MLQTEWGWTVVVDLFMSGFGACLFIAAAALLLCAAKRFEKAIRLGVWIAFGAVAVGVLFLLMDVGQPLRAMWLFGSFANFGSWMPRGAWALTMTLIVFLAVALLDLGRVAAGRAWTGVLRKVLAVLGVCLAAFVTVYTGYLVKGGSAIPFWDSEMLPVSFICASTAAGCTAMLVLVTLTGEGKGAKGANILLTLIAATSSIATIIVVRAFLGEMTAAGGTAAASAEWFLSQGGYMAAQICFALGAVAVFVAGMLGLLGKDARVPAVIGFVAAVIAGVLLRYLVLGAGAHSPLPVPGVEYLESGAMFLFR